MVISRIFFIVIAFYSKQANMFIIRRKLRMAFKDIPQSSNNKLYNVNELAQKHMCQLSPIAHGTHVKVPRVSAALEKDVFSDHLVESLVLGYVTMEITSYS